MIMPMAALRSCSYPGCPNLVRSGRCEKHTYHDAHIPTTQKLFNTNRWKKRRANQLAKEPWCKECLKKGIFTVGTIADHIEPHHGDPVKFFTGKLQTLCKPHSDIKTAQEVWQ